MTCSGPLPASGGLPAGASRRSLACRRSALMSAPSSRAFSLCVSVPKLSLFIRTPVTLDQGPPSRLHVNVITSLMTLFPNKVTL